jgi:hypothetical protein
MKAKISIFIAIASLMGICSCSDSSTSSSKAKSASTPSATDTPAVVPTPEKQYNYYRSGNGYGNVYSHFLPTSIVNWSSANAVPNQNILITDSRFDVRVVVLDVPSIGTTYVDPAGVTKTCLFNTYSYRNVSGSVVIRATPGGPPVGGTTPVSFTKVPIGAASPVMHFTVPPTSTPLILDILSVKSDMACMQYCASNPPPAQYADCCADPMSSNCTNCANIDMPKDCFQLDIQFSTDYTDQFPTCQCPLNAYGSCPAGCWR